MASTSFRISIKDNEVASSLNQIISYLEYLRFEFLRHLYLINTFTFQNQQTESLPAGIHFGSKSELSQTTCQLSTDTKFSKRNEISDIKR